MIFVTLGLLSNFEPLWAFRPFGPLWAFVDCLGPFGPRWVLFDNFQISNLIFFAKKAQKVKCQKGSKGPTWPKKCPKWGNVIYMHQANYLVSDDRNPRFAKNSCCH